MFMDHTCISSWYAVFYDVCLFFVFVFFNFILLYNTVLVLPYIDMNQPQVYFRMFSDFQKRCEDSILVCPTPGFPYHKHIAQEWYVCQK